MWKSENQEWTSGQSAYERRELRQLHVFAVRIPIVPEFQIIPTSSLGFVPDFLISTSLSWAIFLADFLPFQSSRVFVFRSLFSYFRVFQIPDFLISTFNGSIGSFLADFPPFQSSRLSLSAFVLFRVQF
jgi:hypothetical protein